MRSKDKIVQYGICIMCNNKLAKQRDGYCKICKIEHIRNRINENSFKIYYYKFQDTSTISKLRLNSSKVDKGN
jgi:hypothetical protein